MPETPVSSTLSPPRYAMLVSGMRLSTSDTGLLSASDGLVWLGASPAIVCHAPFLIDRLSALSPGSGDLQRDARGQMHRDVAELFAFVLPAHPAVPTVAAFARALGIATPEADWTLLRAVTRALLARLADPAFPDVRDTATLANFLVRAHWPWAPPVLKALNREQAPASDPPLANGLNVWDRIEEWEDGAERPPGSHHPIEPQAARDFLASILGSGLGAKAEKRTSQGDYAAEITRAFRPRERANEANIVLAEAGTGLGKTLGYLAPALLWARRNHAPVWVSTYTRNLQRQLEQEAARMIPDAQERRQRIVTRKGRENYLCLLNMQEAFGRLTMGSPMNPRSALLASLLARWARASRNGDMVGGDFPSWLLTLFRDTHSLDAGRPLSPQSLGLTDRRGECIYSACTHYRRCFVERSLRMARNADIVIANHALVFHQAAIDFVLGAAPLDDDETEPGGIRRIIFDEGHHLFDAADSAFSGHLTGLEAAELRRWLRGAEASGRRGRGLAERIGDLTKDNPPADKALLEVLAAAGALPGPGWMYRLEEGMPQGAGELFLDLVRRQVLARTTLSQNSSVLETDVLPPLEGLKEAAFEFHDRLDALKRPLSALARHLTQTLDVKASELDSNTRRRIEAIVHSLRRRSDVLVAAWLDMLDRIQRAPNALMIDWFALDQSAGRPLDVGYHSHWVDPTEPMARAVLSPADGVVITSATLKDRPPNVPDDWANAELRTGVVHLPYPVTRVGFDSPFDYPAMTRLIVVTDVAREDMDQLGAAYRELFLAAGGGALGLFTAISRLKAVHRRLVQPMAAAGLDLFAQHVDAMDTGTLVDLFRAERDACLLGTDAVRDGVDVPGDSLRLIVMDRVPWGSPSILERARKQAFGGEAWQDMVVRFKLRQAFGRLVRTHTDRGVFVMLDARLASRFRNAFPAGLAIERMGLVDAIDAVAAFLPRQEQALS